MNGPYVHGSCRMDQKGKGVCLDSTSKPSSTKKGNLNGNMSLTRKKCWPWPFRGHLDLSEVKVNISTGQGQHFNISKVNRGHDQFQIVPLDYLCDCLLVFNNNATHTAFNIFDLDLTIPYSKVKCNAAVGLPMYGFLLLFNTNYIHVCYHLACMAALIYLLSLTIRLHFRIPHSHPYSWKSLFYIESSHIWVRGKASIEIKIS